MQMPIITTAANLKVWDSIDGSVVTQIETLANGDVKVLFENDATGECDYHTFWAQDQFTVIRDVE